MHKIHEFFGSFQSESASVGVFHKGISPQFTFLFHICPAVFLGKPFHILQILHTAGIPENHVHFRPLCFFCRHPSFFHKLRQIVHRRFRLMRARSFDILRHGCRFRKPRRYGADSKKDGSQSKSKYFLHMFSLKRMTQCKSVRSSACRFAVINHFVEKIVNIELGGGVLRETVIGR